MAVYFLSDLHLGASGMGDVHVAEQRVCRFLDSIRHDATALYLVGDILDYWYEYRHVVPRGYVRFFGKLAELADAGVKIVWLIGNHDIWIHDYLPTELGVEVVDGVVETEIDGSRFFITHGDGVEQRDLTFKILRGIFRNKVCQALYSSVHPRWTVPLAYTWSRRNRKAHDMRAKRERLNDGKRTEDHSLVPFAREYLALHPDINFFIFGHTHTLSDTPISDTCRVVILGDWIHKFSYARFADGSLTLNRYRES